MLVRIQTVKQLLLFLDLPADDGEVEHLNEMRDIHSRVLNDMAVLLVGVHGGGVVVLGLHHDVLKLY